MQLREQMEIAKINDMVIVVCELADLYYEEYTTDFTTSLPVLAFWERQPDRRHQDGENHSLDDF